MSRTDKDSTPTYYGCISNRHTEFTCHGYSLLNKRFGFEQWCQPCQQVHEGRL